MRMSVRARVLYHRMEHTVGRFCLHQKGESQGFQHIGRVAAFKLTYRCIFSVSLRAGFAALQKR